MNGIPSYIISAILVGTSVALIRHHVLAWRRLNEGELDDQEENFRYRQFRRRMQTSAMIGLLGVAIAIGQVLFDVARPGKLLGYYWIGVLLLLLWIVLLAVADMVATSSYYSRARSDMAVGHAKLQIELRKARERAGRRHNGESDEGQ